MKDKLLYLTIGVLVGVVVMQWTMPSGQASIVDSSSSGVIAHFAEYMLDENGLVWKLPFPDEFGQDVCWRRLPENDVPAWLLPEIKFWHLTVIVTHDNVAWKNVSPGAWESCGAWPDSPVPVQQSTFGNLKSQYKGEEE